MNVDQKEINKFSALAHRWWDVDGDLKTLHRINPLRLGFIKSQLSSLGNKKIIDIGCGGGILSEAMAKEGAFVTGIDMGKDALEVANLHSLETELEIDYHLKTAEDFAISNANSFDIVTCMELLEHVPDPESVVKACIKLAKPDGLIFFSSLNRNLKSYLMAIVAAEYLLKMLPKGTHDYQCFIRPSELVGWCNNYNADAIKMVGLHYNPLTGKYNLGGNTDVNYILCVRKQS